MSALVISAVTLLVALGGSFAGFYSRVNAINFEYKERSYALAQACVSQRLVELANDSSFTTESTTTVSGANGSCYTSTVTANETTYQFKTRAYVSDAYTLLDTTANASDFSIQSQTERTNM